MDGLQAKPSRTTQIQPIHTPPQRHPKKHPEAQAPEVLKFAMTPLSGYARCLKPTNKNTTSANTGRPAPSAITPCQP